MKELSSDGSTHSMVCGSSFYGRYQMCGASHLFNLKYGRDDFTAQFSFLEGGTAPHTHLKHSVIVSTCTRRWPMKNMFRFQGHRSWQMLFLQCCPKLASFLLRNLWFVFILVIGSSLSPLDLCKRKRAHCLPRLFLQTYTEHGGWLVRSQPPPQNIC